ncbi:hypothetical protein NFI96_020429 [Prochilodus magdalenae]|nr:hypothetical protein NFI96_020429 [Prochilodus magdalenae]
MISVIILTLSLRWTAVFAGDSGVTQTPTVLWVEMGNSAEMTCTHSKGNLYFHMYWFRQQQGKPMELIVYTSTSSTPDFGKFSTEKFSATKERAENGSFTVKNVESDDSALYFCAVMCFIFNIVINHKMDDYRQHIQYINHASIVIIFTGSSSPAQSIYQTPPDLITEEKSAELHCSQSIKNHEVTLWYKQSMNNQLHLLGYLSMTAKFPEDALKSKIKLDGDGRNNSTLTITDLQANDSAVYFCAARYTVLQAAVPFNKNPPPSELHK